MTRNQNEVNLAIQEFLFDPRATKSGLPHMRVRAEKETAVCENRLIIVRDEERNRWEYESFPGNGMVMD